MVGNMSDIASGTIHYLYLAQFYNERLVLEVEMEKESTD